MDFVTREKLVGFCIKHGRDVRKAGKDRKMLMKEVMFGRQREKGRVVDVKERNKLTEALKTALRQGGTLRHEHLELIDVEQLIKINTLLAAVDKPKNSVCMLLEHKWWCKTVKKDVVWKGRVIRMKLKKSTNDPMIRVSYWRPEEGEDHCVDSNFQFCKVIADLIMGTLILI